MTKPQNEERFPFALCCGRAFYPGDPTKWLRHCESAHQIDLLGKQT